VAAIGLNWKDVWKPVWKAVWTPSGDGLYVSWAQLEITVPSTVTGGKPKKTRKRRLQLEIDGEVIEVNSVQEAETILEEIRVKAEEKARVAVSRATKVKRKEVRDVIRDARKTLQVPEITAPPDLRDYASQMIGQIRAEYESALKSIEIGVLIARQEAEIEQDDEEILMLL
jgi:hypothetical protein